MTGLNSQSTSKVWANPTTSGSYYLVLDANQNGNYDSSTDFTFAFSVTTYDYSVTISSAQTVLRGSSASYTATVTLAAGSTGTIPLVSLSTSTLPTGVSGAFVPPSVTPTLAGVTSTLTVSTTGSASLGAVPFTVTAGSKTSSSTTLNIYDFSVSVSPSAKQDVAPGDSIDYIITLTLLPGSTTANSITLDLTDKFFPDSFTTEFSANPITPTLAGATSTLTITTASPPTDYFFTVTGTDSYGGSVTSDPSNELNVLPEYVSGALAALGACFGGFLIFKKRSSLPQLRFK